MHRPPTERPTPGRYTLALLAAPLVVLVIMSYIGDALAPTLVDRHPLLLIALNARNRNLALTTNLLDPLPYYVVGTLRLLASDPLFYLLGWYYGDAAVKWAERNTRTFGDLLRMVEKYFAKLAVPLVFAAPNNFICLFAGAAGMRPVVFFAANISGTIARLWVIRQLGNVFSEPIDWILDLIAQYRMPLLVLSVVVVALTILSEYRSGRGELEGLTHLEAELEEASREVEADAESAPSGSVDEGDEPPDRPPA
ncbi:MAG TPA: hypothetical protein VK866_07740 [Acidimicrobiales bacterium]|nr:hypothetical protein [Acidimicrobiales bacterium]